MSIPIPRDKKLPKDSDLTTEKEKVSKALKEKLFLERKNGYYTMTDEDIKACLNATDWCRAN